jgi:hypothetical protein
MAALCIYFAREVVHDFGFSGDVRDTVAVVGEQPSGQWPIQKDNVESGEQSYAVAAPVPEPLNYRITRPAHGKVLMSRWNDLV